MIRNLRIYRILLFIVIPICCVISFVIIWDIRGLTIALHTTFNVIVMFILNRYGMQALRDYERQKKAGIKEPVFTTDCLISDKGITTWKKLRKNNIWVEET